MEQKTKKILIIALVAFGIVVVILALVLGLVFGLRVKIVNSYDNTDELIKKFPVLNPTTVEEGLEERIQNRLLTGFENWNRGFDAWKKWGDILYTEASIYIVHGGRLTLAQYQKSMDDTLKKVTILMGDFHNMLICGNFTAIYYDIITNGKKGTVMEFVVFKDYEDDLGTRVVVGWGGTKDSSVNSMRSYQGEHESMVQDEEDLLLKNYQYPSTETNLKKKYPVLYPSEYKDPTTADAYINIILNGFEAWNNGYSDYETWVNNNYEADAISVGLKATNRTMTQYKSEIQELFATETITKLYFDNILIRDEWAALHYRFRSVKISNSEISVGDRMEFLKFKKVGSTYKIEASFIK